MENRKVLLMMPNDLLYALDKLCQKESVTRSEKIRELVRAEVRRDRLESDPYLEERDKILKEMAVLRAEIEVLRRKTRAQI